MPKPRILLVHAYAPSMPPVVESFRSLWPEAETLNVLDESLYADVGEDGALAPDVYDRVATLLRHAQGSRADGILFTGSTFGPAVDKARQGIGIPVLKSDEALCARIARAGRSLIVCTAKRALPVIRANVEAEADKIGAHPVLDDLWAAGAKEALIRGDTDAHDRSIAEAILRTCQDRHALIALGQFSMATARRLLPPEVAERTVCGPDCAVAEMRELTERNNRAPGGPSCARAQ